MSTIKRQDPTVWLRRALRDGPRPGVAIISEAQQAGIALATLNCARTKLGVQSYLPKKWAAWLWRLPERGSRAGPQE